MRRSPNRRRRSASLPGHAPAPGLLARMLYAKFGGQQPFNSQSETFAREGIELDVSTLADWVGACTVSLAPLIHLIRRHVLAGERLHGDDTTAPVLAKDKTVICRGGPAARCGPFATWTEEREGHDLEVVARPRGSCRRAVCDVVPIRASSRAVPTATTGEKATGYRGRHAPGSATLPAAPAPSTPGYAPTFGIPMPSCQTIWTKSLLALLKFIRSPACGVAAERLLHL
jgi:transposase IS66 family protein